MPDADQRLGPAFRWALEHLPDNPAIGQFARAADMTRRSFYREFRACTGTTPYRWLVAQRVLLACRLLETTQLPIEEIAQHSGFGDASVLRKHLALQTALTPTAYRQTFGHASAADVSR